MKNTELIKVNNLLNFKGELDKIKPLTQEQYTAREAAKFFGCTMSQIKGYINNYKQYFTKSVEVVGTPGKQETRISKEGMFLLAILLDKKSTVAGAVTNAVRELIANNKQEEIEIPQEPVFEKTEQKVKEKAKKKVEAEPKKETKKEEHEQLKMNLDKPLVEVERVVMKNGKVEKEDSLKISQEELKNIDSLKEKLDKFFNNIKEEKKEVKENTETEDNSISKEEMLAKIVKNIAKIKKEIEKEVNCNVQSNTDESKEEMNLRLLSMAYDLKEDNIILDNYMQKCLTLGFEELESAIMLQEAFVQDKNPDKVILNALYQKEKAELSRQRGVLKESIELLASEKFNGKIQDTYHYLSNELRFYMGMNMKKIRDKQKFANMTPTSYLDIIVNEKAFDYAMDIISTLLSE